MPEKNISGDLRDRGLLNWRLKNILDSMDFKEPEKIPVGFDYLYWPYGYAGATLEQVIHDPELNAATYCRFMDDIEFDFTMSSGSYRPYDAYNAIGSSTYSLCADRCTVQHDQANHKFIDDEDYDILIRDYEYFRKEYFPKKSVPALRKPRAEAFQMLKNAAKNAARCIRTSELIAHKATVDHQIVTLWVTEGPAVSPQFFAPIDTLFDVYRGMMGVFYDLAENTEKLDAACEAISEYNNKNRISTPENYDGSLLPFGFAVYHSAPFLSPDHYDKYWFRGFKNTLLPYAEKGLKIYIKGESSFMHTIERFREFPKGSVLIQLDSDDPFEAKKAIGDWQPLCTGMRTSMLVLGDKQKCKDHIKESFDILAPGGGFLFYVDKPLLSPSDGDPELIRELWQFANDYSRKR